MAYKYTISSRFLALIGLMIGASSINAQGASKPNTFFSYGLQLGAIGWAATFVEPEQGSVPMHRAANRPVSRLDPPRNGQSSTFSANSSLGCYLSYSRRSASNDVVSLGLSLLFNRSSYTFGVPYTIAVQNIAWRYWHENHRYLAALPSVKYSWLNNQKDQSRYQRYTFVSLGAGWGGYHVNFGSVGQVGQQEDYRKNGEGITSVYLGAKRHSWLFCADLGQRFEKRSGTSAIEVGMSVYWSNGTIYSKRLEFYADQKKLGGTRLDISGTMVLLSCRYLFNKGPRAAAFVDSVYRAKPVFELSRVKGRSLDVQHYTKLKEQQVELSLWDEGELDGERVTVYLNGEVVLPDHLVDRQKKKAMLHLQPGQNYLSIHAESLGKNPPVVLSLSLSTNRRTKTRLLRSDFTSSGTWKIVVSEN